MSNRYNPDYEEIMYMCMTDFDTEMGHSEVEMYPSVEQLKKERECVSECGIVEVNVKFSRVVQEPNYNDRTFK